MKSSCRVDVYYLNTGYTSCGIKIPRTIYSVSPSTVPAEIRCWYIRVCHPFEFQAMPLRPVGMARGVPQAVWDEKSPFFDKNFLFGTALSNRISFAQSPLLQQYAKAAAGGY